MNDFEVEIYCDGACRGNPGPGGWGVVLRIGHHEEELNGFKKKTTNNEMELTAAIEGLRTLKEKSVVKVVTDSNYVVQGMKEWIFSWSNNGWKTASKKPVKNKSLWQELKSIADQHLVEWTWVKGHAGHAGNERADMLANEAMDENL
jgi:ribonuclease HI